MWAKKAKNLQAFRNRKDNGKYIRMSKTHGGKGSKPRPIDRKAWDNSKLWQNFKKGKSDKELKKRLLAEGGIDILTGLEQGE